MERSLLILACAATVLGLAVGAKVTRPPTPAPADLVTVLTGMGNYSQILYLLNQAGIVNDLLSQQNVTYFLPTDAAMSRVPAQTLNDLQADPGKLKALLGFHVHVGRQKRLNVHSNDMTLNSTIGKPIRVNVYQKPISIKTAEGIKVVQEDIHVANGYVNGIDGIMTPPEGNVTELICGRPDMTTLCSLLKMTNLSKRIDHDNDITMFCPTDAAFAKLAPGVVSYLTNGNHTAMLKNIILYHMVQSTTLYSAGMRHAMTFDTSDKAHDPLMLIEDGSGEISINNAHVSEKDISADNGVMHVIDDVLIPTSVLLNLENINTVVG